MTVEDGDKNRDNDKPLPAASQTKDAETTPQEHAPPPPDAAQKTQPDQTSPAQLSVEALIQRFEGVEALAAKTKITVEEIEGWKQQNQIPAKFHDILLETSDELGRGLTREAFGQRPSRVRIPPSTTPRDTLIDETAQEGDRPMADTQTSTEDTETPPVQIIREKRRGGGFTLFVSFIALIVGGAALTDAYWMPHAKPYIPAAYLPPAAEDSAQQDLAAQLAELEKRFAQSQTENPQLIALAERVTTLEDTLTNLGAETQDAQKALIAPLAEKEALDALGQQIAALEDQMKRLTERQATDTAMRTAEAPSEEPPRPASEDSERFEKELQTFATRLETVDQGLAKLQKDTEETKRLIADIPSSSSQPATAPTPTLSVDAEKLKDRIAALETLVADLSEIEPKSLEKRLGQRLARGLQRLDDRIEGLATENERSDARDAAMRTELEGLAKSSAFADKQVVNGLAARTDALKKQVEAISATFNKLTSGSSGAGRDLAVLKANQAKITQAVAALQQAAKNQTPQLGTLMLAIGQLRDRALSSVPFTTELDVVRQLLPENTPQRESLQPLQARAEKGVASMADLRLTFTAMAKKALADTARVGDGDWVDRSLARFSELVTIRQVGDDTPQDSLDGKLWRAQSLLEDGDLAAAITALEATQESYPLTQRAMAPWLEQARQRLGVEQSLDSLAQFAIQHGK